MRCSHLPPPYNEKAREVRRRARGGPDSTDLFRAAQGSGRLTGPMRTATRPLEIFMSVHDGHDHDDHGGLHRDLRSTAAAMDRRGLLRVAARFGVTFGALQLFGCSSSDAATLTGTDPSSTTPSDNCVAKIPDE